MLSKGPSKERLQCSLELAAAKNLTGLEHVRAVYQCYQDSPEQWEVEKFVIGKDDLIIGIILIVIMIAVIILTEHSG